MIVSVEISYYPLHNEYLEPIGDFIERVKQYDRLWVRVNGMSTQVIGEYDEVMPILTKEIRKSIELPASVFVMKILNADLRDTEE